MFEASHHSGSIAKCSDIPHSMIARTVCHLKMLVAADAARGRLGQPVISLIAGRCRTVSQWQWNDGPNEHRDRTLTLPAVGQFRGNLAVDVVTFFGRRFCAQLRQDGMLRLPITIVVLLSCRCILLARCSGSTATALSSDLTPPDPRCRR